MACLEKLLRFLDRQGVPYVHTTHPTAYTAKEVASAEHLPQHEIAKTVVIHTEEGYRMVVLPANMYLDLFEVRTLMGFQQARLATEQEMAPLFPDCELGAMPPIGMLYDMPVLVDRTLAADEKISFNAGTHRDVVRISFDDFRRITEPLIANVARQLTAHQAAW